MEVYGIEPERGRHKFPVNALGENRHWLSYQRDGKNNLKKESPADLIEYLGPTKPELKRMLVPWSGPGHVGKIVRKKTSGGEYGLITGHKAPGSYIIIDAEWDAGDILSKLEWIPNPSKPDETQPCGEWVDE
jgi:hypothetical protein